MQQEQFDDVGDGSSQPLEEQYQDEIERPIMDEKNQAVSEELTREQEFDSMESMRRLMNLKI